MAVALILGSSGAPAFTQPAPAGPAPASGPPPVVIKLATGDIKVESGGLYTETLHTEISPTNEAAAKTLGEQRITYSEATEDLDVTEAYTLKATAGNCRSMRPRSSCKPRPALERRWSMT